MLRGCGVEVVKKVWSFREGDMEVRMNLDDMGVLTFSFLARVHGISEHQQPLHFIENAPLHTSLKRQAPHTKLYPVIGEKMNSLYRLVSCSEPSESF